MDRLHVQPHINLRPGQVQPVVLTVGDPQRVDMILELCDSSEELAFSREFRSATAVAKGQKFTVISHGIGTSAAMICFEELIKCGAKVIIRAGTCGSLKPDKIKTGDVFVPHAVARDTDTTELYAPLGMPAVATPLIYQALMDSGKELGVLLRSGIGLSNGLFYHAGEEQQKRLRTWSSLVDIVEFEFQGLFLVGAARGIETGGIATVDGSPLEWNENYSPTGEQCIRGKRNMLHVAVNACANLSKRFGAA